jgi:uroporphyrinogen decarboxylase
MNTRTTNPESDQMSHGTDRTLVSVLRGTKATVPPIWLMRQAGRHLPEYRDLRARNSSFLDFCYAPAAAAEATLQPTRRYDIDAAIIFSDILVIPHALGRKVWFVEGEGPRLEAITGPNDVVALDPSRVETRLGPVYEAIERVRSALEPSRSLIGFVGAPWTLATYMIQGKGGDRVKVRAFAYAHPEVLSALLDVLADAVADHLVAQVRAGADVVQIFESWAEDLPELAFQQWVIAPIARAVARFRLACPTTPIIGFPRGASQRAGAFHRGTGVDGVGMDIGADLRAAREAVGSHVALQGNLDPIVLAAGGPALDTAIDHILDAAVSGPHVFNLGHGVIPATPIAHVQHLVGRVKGTR